jgi:hypothetical protein
MTNYYNLIFPKYVDKSVKNKDCFRINVAKEQAKMKTVAKDDIISYVNNFLESIDMVRIKEPEVDLEKNPIKRGRYAKMKEENNLKDKKDIVWIKFTKDNYLGVVASGADINFNMDNTSGKIINALGKEWDESYVLVFPLINRYSDVNRHRIESAIGNYLISQNVPILDYYSHNL